jgi:hypothetical protein
MKLKVTPVFKPSASYLLLRGERIPHDKGRVKPSMPYKISTTLWFVSTKIPDEGLGIHHTDNMPTPYPAFSSGDNCRDQEQPLTGRGASGQRLIKPSV